MKIFGISDSGRRPVDMVACSMDKDVLAVPPPSSPSFFYFYFLIVGRRAVAKVLAVGTACVSLMAADDGVFARSCNVRHPVFFVS